MAYPITTTREQRGMALPNSSSNCVKQFRQVGKLPPRSWTPCTVFQDVRRLAPSHLSEFEVSGGGEAPEVEFHLLAMYVLSLWQAAGLALTS